MTRSIRLQVTDSELLPICNESDGLSEYGTFQINGRPVTRMPSPKFAETMPWDLQGQSTVSVLSLQLVDLNSNPRFPSSKTQENREWGE